MTCTTKILTQRKGNSFTQTTIQMLSVEMPSLRFLAPLQPKNVLFKEKTIWSVTKGWFTLSIKQTKRCRQLEKSQPTLWYNTLASWMTTLSSSIELNSKRLMEFGKQSLVPKPKNKWKYLQGQSSKTPSTALENKFSTSLFAKLKVASTMHLTISRLYRILSWLSCWEINSTKQMHENTLACLRRKSSPKT